MATCSPTNKYKSNFSLSIQKISIILYSYSNDYLSVILVIYFDSIKKLLFFLISYYSYVNNAQSIISLYYNKKYINTSMGG